MLNCPNTELFHMKHGHRNRTIQTETHIQSVLATEGVKIQLSYWQCYTPFFTSHTSKPTIKQICMNSHYLKDSGQTKWEDQTGINQYHTLLHEVTAQALSNSLDVCYPGKQQKIAQFKNSSVLFYPRVITEHSAHSFWRAEYNSCLLPSALQFSIYLSLSHREQTAQKCSRQEL